MIICSFRVALRPNEAKDKSSQERTVSQLALTESRQRANSHPPLIIHIQSWRGRLVDLMSSCHAPGPFFSLALALPSPSLPMHKEHQFRFWVDKSLWTKGKEAVQLVEVRYT